MTAEPIGRAAALSVFPSERLHKYGEKGFSSYAHETRRWPKSCHPKRVKPDAADNKIQNRLRRDSSSVITFRNSFFWHRVLAELPVSTDLGYGVRGRRSVVGIDPVPPAGNPDQD
jgi:hypothetical protein